MSGWRPAEEADDEVIIELSLALYAEDPSPEFPTADQVHRTLRMLRAEPVRGRAVVWQPEIPEDEPVAGYAFLIAFWSNELGGEVCVVDELYVRAAHRNAGVASSLFEELARRAGSLWPGRPAALMLETTPTNARARALYERLGFTGKNLSFRRKLS